MDDINELFENAIRDPSLLSTLDIDSLLSSLENDKNDYLENKTIDSVIKEIYNIVNNVKDINQEKKLEYCQKLNEYRYVPSINELHKGKHIKWIRIDFVPDPNRPNKARLVGGGIVVDIKFRDNGTHVLVRNEMNRFIQIKFDDCYIFQKMNLQEQLILMAYGYLEKNHKP
jgi:hypothetical protein